MKIDRIFSYIRGGEQVFNEEILAENLIKKKFWHKKNSEELFIFFPHWGGRSGYHFLLKKYLLKNNRSFLEYEFAKGMLSANAENTLNNFNKIRASVSQEIKKLKKDYKFNKVSIIGVSIGCVNACMIADNNSLIDEIFLILPGHCLAESVWNGIGAQKLKKSYENRGVTLEELKNNWRSLAPENNVNNLKLKKISIFLSESDLIIPFYCGKKLLEKIKSLKYIFTYKKIKYFGHNFALLLFYLNPKKYLVK